MCNEKQDIIEEHVTDAINAIPQKGNDPIAHQY